MPERNGRLEPVEFGPLSEDPLVSVIISNYNYENYVGEALESLLKQTYATFEIIVCDDGSTDGSCTVIEDYAARDSRISLIRKSNGGQASGFNAAFRACNGDLICLMDADDLFAPTKLEAVVEAFRSGPWGMFVHRLIRVDAAGEEVPASGHGLGPIKDGWIADGILKRGGRWGRRQVTTPEPTTALSFRREVADLVFPIPESFRVCADAFVTGLAPLLTMVKASDAGLAHYRLHGSNTFFDKKLTTRKVAKAQRLLVQVVDEANKRLEQLHRAHVRLDVTRNVMWHELVYFNDLLEGKPRVHLVRQYVGLMRRMLVDDLRSSAGKAAAFVLYGAAILLPVKRRSQLLSEGRSWARQWRRPLRLITKRRPTSSGSSHLADASPLVHVVWGDGSGGLQNLVRELVLEQRRMGLSVTVVLATTESGGLSSLRDDSGVPVFPLGLSGGWFVNPIGLFRAARKFPRARIVHLHNFNLALALLFTLRKNCPVVYTEHIPVDVRSRTARWLLKWFLRSRTSRVVAVSDHTASLMESLVGINRSRIATVYNGLRFRDGGEPAPRPAGDTLVVAYVGRLSVGKRVDRLLEAVAEWMSDEIRLRVIGDGHLAKELQDQARALGIDGQVEFLGWRHDVLSLLDDVDVLAHPAPSESFGLVILEACSRGLLPIVFADGGGAVEVLPPDGIVVTNAKELSEWFGRLGQSPLLSLDSRKQRAAWVRATFPIERTAEEYATLYESCLGEGSLHPQPGADSGASLGEK
jgi:glycosyltransferase involved in cell wall biosynthesis